MIERQVRDDPPLAVAAVVDAGANVNVGTAVRPPVPWSGKVRAVTEPLPTRVGFTVSTPPLPVVSNGWRVMVMVGS